MPPSILKTIERLWAPGLLFLAFVASTVFVPDLLAHVSTQALARLSDILFYGVQIGLWLSGAYLLTRLLDVLFWERIVARLTGASVPRLLKDCLALVVFLIAAAGIVGIVFDRSVAGIWATSGAVGIVLGLALRSIILDIFSGLAVNLDHSYRLGDWVELLDRNGPPVFGKVLEINWRTTRIETTDKRTVVVPNSRMGQATISNYTMQSDACRFEAAFTLDFSVPSARAVRVLFAGAKAACGGHGLVERPEPRVVAAGATSLGVEYRIQYWQDINAASTSVARHALVVSVLKHLERAGLTLAYPKQDTFWADMPARQLEHGAEADRATLLRGVEIFGKSMTPDELRQLACAMAPRAVPAGTRLMTEGEPGATMFVLAEGLLEVRLAKDGAEIAVARVQPGEFVGEMSLLTGEPRSATVAAATDTLGYEIAREHLAPLLAERPALSEAISRIVAARRLNMADALSRAGQDRAAAEAATLSAAAQILQRMRFLFRGLFERHATATGAATVGAGVPAVTAAIQGKSPG
ncbi:MAG TPA: mechanosensitive ion channel family protein [Stellaceae bacterium]|jgi:small-conductance mechanosensitive channel/CRP-like cAMP-binding protein